MRRPPDTRAFTGATPSPLSGVALLFLASYAMLAAPAAHAADPERGRELYGTHCASCHGPRGVPVMPGAPDFTRPDALLKPDPVLVQSVRFGRNAMPAFQGLLREKDMLDAIAYLRTLR